MDAIDRKRLTNTISKASKYLINSTNKDGGIKFEDEFSEISGSWVTAETLEALLESNVLPITCYKKVEPMILFLISNQNDDGSWSILTKDSKKPSAISTGHCVYSLKLAARDGYYSTKEIYQAIERGEAWLRDSKCCIDRNGYAFWSTEPIEQGNVVDCNSDVISRMEYVFSSFYAVMGFINPDGFIVKDDIDINLIEKAKRFFVNQATFFIEKYKSEIEKLDDILQFAKVSSTICRIVNAIDMLRIEIPNNIQSGLKDLLSLCSKNPFMTTSITVHTDRLAGFTAVYNNNTPFDMANAFLSINTDSGTLFTIIEQYIENQSKEGFWYLNFSSAYKIKTWTTAEAIIVLNKALRKYNEVEFYEKQKEIDSRHDDLLLKYKHLRIDALISTIISMAICIGGIIGLIIWNSQPENKDTTLHNILSLLIIPLAIWLFKQMWGLIKSIIEITKETKSIKESNKKGEDSK